MVPEPSRESVDRLFDSFDFTPRSANTSSNCALRKRLASRAIWHFDVPNSCSDLKETPDDFWPDSSGVTASGQGYVLWPFLLPVNHPRHAWNGRG